MSDPKIFSDEWIEEAKKNFNRPWPVGPVIVRPEVWLRAEKAMAAGHVPSHPFSHAAEVELWLAEVEKK